MPHKVLSYCTYLCAFLFCHSRVTAQTKKGCSHPFFVLFLLHLIPYQKFFLHIKLSPQIPHFVSEKPSLFTQTQSHFHKALSRILKCNVVSVDKLLHIYCILSTDFWHIVHNFYIILPIYIALKKHFVQYNVANLLQFCQNATMQ